jgi:tRNA 2-selenouridine synthase SelU
MPQTSLSQRFFTNTKDAADSMHKQAINFNGLARDLYSNFGKTENESQPKKMKKKKKVVKKLKSFESFMDTDKSREEMILQLCNSGYERWELDTCTDVELKDMCKEVPEETVTEKRKVTKKVRR